MREHRSRRAVAARSAAGLVVLSLATAACDSTGTGVGDDADPGFPGISVTAPAPIEYGRDTIQLRPELPAGTAPAGMAASVAAGELAYNIVRVAHIQPVEVETDAGTAVVQANDILVDQSGHTAYIAYNYKGDPWIGALQVVDLRDRDRPEIVRQLAFEHMDVNAVYLDGNRLLIAGAADPDRSEQGFLSFVTHVDAATLDPAEVADGVTGLPSFAGTGVARHGDRYYVSVGARDGSIQVLDTDFQVVGQIDRADVRDVDAHSSGIIALAGTTDNGSAAGQVMVASAGDLANPTLLDIVDFDSDYHKATIEVWEGTVALLGLSSAGWKAIDTRDPGSYLAEIPNPDCSAQEILCNTNSVSTDGSLIFTANGQYGFRVFRPRSKNDFVEPEIIGYYRPDAGEADGYTANHVEMKAGYLFVASGAKGVYIYALEERNP